VHAQAGDVLVLTKALGTNLATNMHTWLDAPDKWSRVSAVVSRDDGACGVWRVAWQGCLGADCR
jgi:hypothetical protein